MAGLDFVGASAYSLRVRFFDYCAYIYFLVSFLLVLRVLFFF